MKKGQVEFLERRVRKISLLKLNIERSRVPDYGQEVSFGFLRST